MTFGGALIGRIFQYKNSEKLKVNAPLECQSIPGPVCKKKYHPNRKMQARFEIRSLIVAEGATYLIGGVL